LEWAPVNSGGWLRDWKWTASMTGNCGNGEIVWLKGWTMT